MPGFWTPWTRDAYERGFRDGQRTATLLALQARLLSDSERRRKAVEAHNELMKRVAEVVAGPKGRL